MKKILYFATLLFGLALTSCEKDDIGGTATEATAGQWYVTVDAADENGNLVAGFEDLFGLGRVIMLTYNTSANNPNEMIVSDNSTFWDFKVKVNCDQQALTFQTTTTENNNLVADYEDINVQVTGGKILPQAGRQNNGSPADSIVFYVSFSDDDYPAAYGYKNYRVSGVRYSGLVEND
ncbi:MAG: hypothetical protein K6C10_09045 [Prevotella sp.]|nr:hypothetical protein [Prevotella sp.]